MNEITLQCSDAPDAPKANFLATLNPISTSGGDEEDLPFEITLDRYTRDPWSVLKPPNDEIWKFAWFKSIDGKNRLPDFLKFLKERKKAAYGKFESPHPDEVTGDINTALFLVPFEQPLCPEGESAQDLIYVKYCLDERLTKITPKPKQVVPNQQRRGQHRPNPVQQPVMSSGLGRGLLGNLLGATHRTNQHLDTVPARKKEKQKSFDTVTSGQIINKFREKVEKQLAEFGSSSKTEIKISVSIAELTREMDSMEEKSKVTMDVIKYVVNELVDDLNEEWVAAREQGEFTDEAVFAVYKAGYAPADVLEDMNKGEVPDEVKQEQRATREALGRKEDKKLRMLEDANLKKANLKKAAGRNAEFSALNTAKRDRRSIEEIQKGMMVDNQKKGRMS